MNMEIHEIEAYEYILQCKGARLSDVIQIPHGRRNSDFIIEEEKIVLEYKNIRVDRLGKKIKALMNGEKGRSQEALNRDIRNLLRDGFRGIFEAAGKQIKQTKEFLKTKHSDSADWLGVLMVSNDGKIGDTKINYEIMQLLVTANLLDRTEHKGAQHKSIDAVLFVSLKNDANVLIDMGEGSTQTVKYFRLLHRDKIRYEKDSPQYKALRAGWRAYIEKTYGQRPVRLDTGALGAERIKCSMDETPFTNNELGSVWLFPQDEDGPDIIMVQ